MVLRWHAQDLCPAISGDLAVWKALDDAKQRGYRRPEFMDVGLPFRKHGYREFVLRFGGNKAAPDAGSVSVGTG